MALKEKIIDDLKAAMKSGDSFRRDTLRMLDAMIKNTEIEKRKKEEGLNDTEVQEVISRAIKQRKDAAAQYESGGRPELAEKEKKEMDILLTYMPKQMSEEEIKSTVQKIIKDLGATDKNQMGKVMGTAMGQLKGKADGQTVKKIVEKILNNMT